MGSPQFNPMAVGFPPTQAAGETPPPAQPMMQQMMGAGPGDLAALQAQSQLDQTAGLLDQLKELNATLTEAQDLMMTAATQFPGSAQYVRTVVEALDIANRGLVDVLTAVLSQTQAPEPPAPRYLP